MHPRLDAVNVSYQLISFMFNGWMWKPSYVFHTHSPQTPCASSFIRVRNWLVGPFMWKQELSVFATCSSSCGGTDWPLIKSLFSLTVFVSKHKKTSNQWIQTRYWWNWEELFKLRMGVAIEGEDRRFDVAMQSWQNMTATSWRTTWCSVWIEKLLNSRLDWWRKPFSRPQCTES